MKSVAVIGSGIGGIASAYYLQKEGFDVTIFEASDYFGGHSNTVEFKHAGKDFIVDTGFLVHNDRTYPNFCAFLKELNIHSYSSEMTFSVKRGDSDLEWAGTDLSSLFGQRKNIFNFKFYKFIYEILRFNRESERYLANLSEDADLSLGDLLTTQGYSKEFLDWYLLPMGGAIWSTPTDKMLEFPARTFLIFCKNHGLLQVTDRPRWKTLVGGSRAYVNRALLKIEKKYLGRPVLELRRTDGRVQIVTQSGITWFDYAVMATHPPTTLKIIKDLSSGERDLLSSFKYQKNIAVLHVDERVLPQNKRVWSAWNYESGKNSDGKEAVSVHYLINKLQKIDNQINVIVSLNPIGQIDKTKMIKKIDYEHPLFDAAAILAQKRMDQIQGNGSTYFAGAWLRYGFHEDGISSALNVVKKIKEKK